MNDDGFAPNLDMVETRWSMLRRAHQPDDASAADARNFLVLRYAPAIRGYIQALTKNDADADELAQDVIVRLIQGDFSGADPQRGRFRDLLKVSVKNMVRSFWSKRQRRGEIDKRLAQESGADESYDREMDRTWSAQCRDALIETAMARLEVYQNANAGNVYYDALRIRSGFPDLDSTGLAEELSKLHGREINAANYRQQLKRARTRFAEFIVEEIAQGLDVADAERIQQELIDLGLYEYIKDVLPAKWQATAS
jgi:RNA polymerase sigma factor (sigma-70 family)